jgi:hypothetical protein
LRQRETARIGGFAVAGGGDGAKYRKSSTLPGIEFPLILASRDAHSHPDDPHKRGRAPSGTPFTSHRGDRDFATTLLFVPAGAHGVGEGVLGFFDTREARALRLVCAEFWEAIASAPRADERARIKNVGRRRTFFPRARKVSISMVRSIVDADCAYFEGIHTLSMSGCRQAGITDAAFAHLKGIYYTLEMWGCDQAGITDATLVHLAGIALAHYVGVNPSRGHSAAASAQRSQFFACSWRTHRRKKYNLVRNGMRVTATVTRACALAAFLCLWSIPTYCARIFLVAHAAFTRCMPLAIGLVAELQLRIIVQ